MPSLSSNSSYGSSSSSPHINKRMSTNRTPSPKSNYSQTTTNIDECTSTSTMKKGILKTPRRNINHNINNNTKQYSYIPNIFKFNSKNYLLFLWILIAIPSLLWTTQWNNRLQQDQRQTTPSTLKPTNIYNSPSITIVDSNLSDSINSNDESILLNSDVNQSIDNEYPVEPSINEQRQILDLQMFDPSNHAILSPDVYKPSSKNPLQVIYAGVLSSSFLIEDEGENDDDDDEESSNDTKKIIENNINYTTTSLLLEGIQFSKYIKPIASFIFNFQKLVEKDSIISEYQNENIISNIWQINLNNKTPIVIIIDWSSIKRDCHILQKILYEINNYYDNILLLLNTTDNVHIVLVDDSPSTRIIKCKQLSLLNNLKVTVAKRSIVEGRYWNHTKQWIEPGQLLAIRENTNNSLLRLPLSISESWVMLLQNTVKELYTDNNENNNVDYTEQIINDINRTTDITILYDGESSHYSFFRKKIMNELNKLFLNTKQPLIIKSMNINPDNL